MILELFSILVTFVTPFILNLGYAGIFFLMIAESAMIPIPSEIIMPFSGFLVASGKLSFIEVVIAGSIGNLIGSIITYFVGIKFGRLLIIKYGKYFFFNEKHLQFTEKLFGDWGDKISLIGRLLPGIRTYVSFPLGIAKSNFIKFVIYTLIGSLIWNILLTYVGVKLGKDWQNIHQYSSYLDIIAVVIVISFIVWFVYRLRKTSIDKKSDIS